MHFIQPYRHSLLSPNGASAYHKVSAYVSKQRLCGNTYLNTQSYFVLDPMGSHCEGPNSIAEQCTWKLWCTTVTALLQALPSFHKQIIIPIMFYYFTYRLSDRKCAQQTPKYHGHRRNPKIYIYSAFTKEWCSSKS